MSHRGRAWELEPSLSGSASVLCMMRGPRSLGETRSWSHQWNTAVRGENRHARGLGPVGQGSGHSDQSWPGAHESR